LGDARAVICGHGVPTSSAVAPPNAQLLVFEFAPEARFEGQLGGALGRLESGGALRILEALFVQRESETAELVVFDVRGDGAGGLITPLLDFRLDPAARRRATERALAAGTPGIPADTLKELGKDLAPGAAIAALLIEHRWAAALTDAVARTSGTPLLSEFVEQNTLAELTQELLSATSGH
jgi:hypothetical protein